MVAWGAIASLAGKALGSLSGSGSSSNATQQLNREDTDWMYGKQSDYWKQNTQWFNENGYSMLKKGLMDAGYNPLMALGAQPLSGATVSGSAMDQSSASKGFEIPKGIMQSMQDVLNTKADTLLKHAQVDETVSRTNVENAEAALKNSELDYADRKNAAITEGIELENALNEAKIKAVEAQTGLYISQAQLSRIQGKYVNAMTSLSYTQQKYYNGIIENITNNIKLTQDQRKWLDAHPLQAQFLQYVNRYGNAFHTIIKGVDINTYNNTNLNL